VRGEPGIGKSALIAHLVKSRGYIHHFNIALQAVNRSEQFLTNICAQLITRFDLNHDALPPGADKDGAFLNQVLVESSNRLGHDERLVIAIDALDEVDRSDLAPRANMLYLPPTLPPGIFIVVTSRPKYDLRLQVANARTLYLESHSADNVQDVQSYIQIHLSDKQMQQRLAVWSVTPEQFTEALLKKSEGNFMYLRYVLPAIKAGRFMLGRLAELPDGLIAYYRTHWVQMKSQDATTFDTFYKPVVCVLAAVKEAVSVEQIAAFSGLEPDRVRQVIREWREFLYEERLHSYRIYHTSFQEFLMEEVDPGLRTYHAMIARYYLRLRNK